MLIVANSIDFPGLWCRSSIWKIKGHFLFSHWRLEGGSWHHDLPIECYKFASQQSWIDGLTHRAWVLEQDWELQWGMSPIGRWMHSEDFHREMNDSRFGDIDMIFWFRGSLFGCHYIITLFWRFGFGIPDLQAWNVPPRLETHPRKPETTAETPWTRVCFTCAAGTRWKKDGRIAVKWCPFAITMQGCL